MHSLQGLDVARLPVDAAADIQAVDIVLLDVRDLTSFADYFVICSATSERQLRAVVDEMERKLKDAGIKPLYLEGTVESGWIVLDCGDVVAHVFSPEQRDYYRLERIWQKAVPVIRIQ